MSSVAAELVVRGLVQGVGYRYYCLRKAHSLNLKGWARNNRDGTVTAFVEGDRSAIEDFIKDLKIGPPSASVSDVVVRWSEFTGGYDDFDITF
ncbi:MAG: acylphosphatase [Candidatus Zixiibacteriota bacterium]